MAQSMSPVVPSLPLQIQSTVARSNSITSTNSANSAVSLRRRSRTRTRALTNTGRRGKSIGPTSTAGADGGDDANTGVALQHQLHPLPTRLPRRSGVSPSRAILVSQELTIPSPRERTHSAVHIRDVPAEASRGRQTRSEGGSTRSLRAKARGVSLPRSAFRTAASSDESSEASPRTPSDSPMAPFARRTSRPFRDSVASSSSSLYPPSTSTESYPESSSLQSLSGKEDEVLGFSPRIVTRENSSDFDVDDVSYRLRLLVNNSYFLPPAHSKPSPLSLAPQNASAQKDPKAAASTFLDFFRMGKSKSKPTTPITRSPPEVDAPAPILRTTSDSTTASGYVSRPRAPAHIPASQPFMAQSNQSRVVVLRERMDDLVAAAKQAERDIKSRGDGRKAKSVTSPKANTFFDDVIDPTDAVDLPPVAAGYPFAVQASALHGLGPGESLGADLLADRLPPSPGMWSMSTEEETWRKALLHEAVSLSLSASPDQSFSTATPSSPSDVASPKSFLGQQDVKTPEPEEPASPPTPKAVPLIGQRIIEPLKLDTASEEGLALSPLSALQSLPSPGLSDRLSVEQVESPWRTSQLPRRAETPAVTQALTPPPPRRELVRSQYSMSSTELSRPSSATSELVSDPLHLLRKVVSSPRLSAVPDNEWNPPDSAPHPESITQRMMSITPPVDVLARESQTSLTRPSITSILRSSPFSEDDDLSYRTPRDDMDGDFASRPSMTLSIPTIGRPSMSEYSNPSPTASAFHDAVFGSCRSPSPLLLRRNHPGAISPTPSESSPPTIPRHIAVSPPPRTSSSLGNTVLPPPPRSPAIKPVYCSSTSSAASARSASSHSSTPLYSPAEHEFNTASELPSPVNVSAPRSPSPSLSLASRRGQTSPLSLQIPTEHISPAIHSAPAPASPTAFFDRIQSHPNAMDDLETSDESDEDDIAAPVKQPSRKPDRFPAPAPQAQGPGTSIRSSSCGSTRPSFMRLGNHSSPHLTSSSNHEDSFPAFDVPDPRKPIGNTPEKGTFFTTRSRKKSGKGQTAIPIASFEAPEAEGGGPVAGPSGTVRSARSHSASRRPTTSGSADQKVRTWQRESLQKFDGMLLEHMAAERDTIKRITSNLSNSRS